MLHVCCWHWGQKYGVEYIDRLRAGVGRNLKQPYRWSVFRPERGDDHLVLAKGCFARLRMFDADWQMRQGIGSGERLVCLDLDSVVTGPLDPLFDRPEPFVILQGANSSNPCPFNGSVMMLRGGYRPDIWSDFSLEAANTIPYYQFPDDQGWLAHKLPDAAGWMAGKESGIYALGKPGWPGGKELPADARLVVFPGYRDPSLFTKLPWVQQHWAI